jgi:hypothetical protein
MNERSPAIEDRHGGVHPQQGTSCD